MFSFKIEFDNFFSHGFAIDGLDGKMLYHRGS